MSSYKDIKIADFTYRLPDEKIAKYPLAERDTSKLLVCKNGEIVNDLFHNCSQFLPGNSKLVFNNTRVIHARLAFRKETGAKIELFCLEPVCPQDYQLAFQQKNKVVWKCMVGNSKKWKAGKLLREVEINDESVTISAEKIEQVEGTFHIELCWDKEFTFAEIIEYTGTLPIPPYLNRETEETDEESYQTVYAKIDGSVAAPTAGLHFTDDVLSKLSEKNIALEELTLHVGAGTFQPVKSETISGHNMHHETVIVSKGSIEGFKEDTQNIIAVGTTSVRSLESLYWIGVQLGKGTFNAQHPEVTQWEPYETDSCVTKDEAFQNILDYLEKSQQDAIQFSTQIIILPGYKFRVINGMFTNFHQPQSTLLLLISAFLGEKWKEVYDFALKNDFRFLSYGDSNLYLR